MSAMSLDDAKNSLLLNGFVRFFIVTAYLGMGLIIGAFAYQNQEFRNMIPPDKLDYLVPIFVLNYLPHGIIGFIVIAMLAAFMSSLDSSINSLSAATMNDLYKRYIRPGSEDGHYFLWSKVLTVFWGAVCTGFAFVVGNISDTIIEAINKVGSLFYGPVLAAFILGILFRKSNAAGVKIGVVSGIAINLILWLGFPGVSWLWWNVTGSLSAIILGYSWSLLFPDGIEADAEELHRPGEHGGWAAGYILLLLYVFFMIAASYICERIWLG